MLFEYRVYFDCLLLETILVGKIMNVLNDANGMYALSPNDVSDSKFKTCTSMYNHMRSISKC